MSFLWSKLFQLSPLDPNLKPKHFKLHSVATWFIIAPSYTHIQKALPIALLWLLFLQDLLLTLWPHLPSFSSLCYSLTALASTLQAHSLVINLCGFPSLDIWSWIYVSHCLTFFSDTFSTRPSLTPPFISTTLPNPHSQHSSSSFADYIFLIDNILCIYSLYICIYIFTIYISPVYMFTIIHYNLLIFISF